MADEGPHANLAEETEAYAAKLTAEERKRYHQDALANLIWQTSRNDEGTISATGANIIAKAIIGAGYEPPVPIDEFIARANDSAYRQIAKEQAERIDLALQHISTYHCCDRVAHILTQE